MSSVSQTFARRLREERERAGISQAEIAHRVSEVLGVSIYPTAVTKIENRERSVKLDESVAIADALGVPLAALLSDRDALGEKIAQTREDLLIAEHAQANALSQASEFAEQAAQLRHHLRELEAAHGR